MLGLRLCRKGRVGPLLEADVLDKLLRYFQIDCVFDVGANQGQYAGKLRERLGFNGPIVSFEPVPELAQCLHRRAARDPFWYIEEVALDNIRRATVFKVMRDSEFSSLQKPCAADTVLLAENNTVLREVSLETGTLDQYYDKYKRLLGFKRPFLKMDTQGNDMQVVAGAQSSIGEFVALQSELAFRRLYEGSVTYRQALDYYESLGFELSALVPNNAGHFPYLIEMDCIMANKNLLFHSPLDT
jgi:FkbM family methyltransferase